MPVREGSRYADRALYAIGVIRHPVLLLIGQHDRMLFYLDRVIGQIPEILVQ